MADVIGFVFKNCFSLMLLETISLFLKDNDKEELFAKDVTKRENNLRIIQYHSVNF